MTKFIDKVPQSITDQLAAELTEKTAADMAAAEAETHRRLADREHALSKLGEIGITGEEADAMLPSVESITAPNSVTTNELTSSTVVTRGPNLGGGYYGDPRPQ